MQDFVPPFKLASLKHIANEEAQSNFMTVSNQEEEEGGSSRRLSQPNSVSPDSYWSCSVSPDRKSPAVLVGKLKGDQGGILQLCQNEVTMDLVITGNAGMSLNKFGTTVALFDYHIVKETFHINEKNVKTVHKLYIVVRVSDLIVLQESDERFSLSKEKNPKKYSYRFQLLSKSALVVPHKMKGNFSLPVFLSNKFFVGRTTIMKIGRKGEILESWQKFVKFFGKHANLYPLLEVGDECELRISSQLDAETVLKQSNTFNWLRCISEDESKKCLFLPPETLVMKVSSVPIKWGEVSVKEVKSQGHESELITIIGTVISKKFVKPIFESEASRLPFDVWKASHIGIPKRMTYSLLIRDENDTNSEIWLYNNCTTNYYTKIYPLGVIPGVRIIATDVMRVVTKRKAKVYLNSSNFTHIIPLSIPKAEKPLTINTPTPNTVTPEDASLSSDTVTVFASVIEITKATLKVVCDNCFHDLEDVSHFCWNCFTQTPGFVEASVLVEIDDGTLTSLILLKGIKHFGILLRLNKKDCRKLSDMVLSQCLNLYYDDEKEECYRTEGLNTSEDFNYMMTEANIAHAYKFTYRKQEPQPYLCVNISLL